MQEENQNQEINAEEFSSEIFNVTGEPDDFTIVLSNISEEAELEIGGRRC